MIRKAKGTERAILEFDDKQIDIEGQWLEIDFIEGLEEATGVKFPTEFESKESIGFLNDLCIKYHVACEEPRSPQRYIEIDSQVT